MRNILIVPVLNGFILEVGCSKVVFNDIDAVLANIRAYQKDPEQVEKEFVAKAINKGCCNFNTPPIAPPSYEGVMQGCTAESANRYREG